MSLMYISLLVHSIEQSIFFLSSMSALSSDIRHRIKTLSALQCTGFKTVIKKGTSQQVHLTAVMSVRTYGLIHSAITDSAVCALGALCI
jgi:hypothetical protein